VSTEPIEISTGFFREMQRSICTALEQADGTATFVEDRWDHPTGGGGITRVIRDGRLLEKGAVNFSRVSSQLTEEAASRMKLPPQAISATGISLILHPQNPYVPTVHANFRYLELAEGTWWLGGGADLTPCYLFEDDVRHFHSTWKRICDEHDPVFYGRFKAWCDSYFYLPHRGETRGVGGIFFDDLSGDFATLFRFVQACGRSFIEAYLPIAERRADQSFDNNHRTWQLQRRGRYAEFNLLYDRGTRFGIDTGGRTESILVSMPPAARWDYDIVPEIGTPEHRLIEVLRSPREWT